MQDGVKLERKTKEELKQIAQGLEIPRISMMKKDEIIAAIREKRAQLEEEAKQQQQQQFVHKKRERPADVVEVNGILDVMNDGFGFLRVNGMSSGPNDIYVSPTQIRRFNLKTGDEICGDSRPSQDEDKYSPLLFVKKINGDPLEIALKRRPFERLTPIYPTERFILEGDTSIAARMIDFVTPVGKGQRGLIVAPPKAGKTTILKSIAQAILKNNPEVYLMVLLIDERPEEVTDIKRSIDGPVYASTFDQLPENHCKVSEMVLERAMRLVEQKKDVVILMDSITRLARAYNLTVTPTGRTLSGGLDPDALHKPKKFFGAARNIEEGGSLTILATALVETGSRMDDVIFEEFKGTGNMELKLDRSLQEKRIFPAIDISKSGTRREEDLLSERELEAARLVRRECGRNGGIEMTARLINFMKHTRNNNDIVELIINNYGKKI
jgi:transcription termination factor Rho